MAYCTRCGSQYGGETEASGLCTSCSQSQSTDVPCQRCGMYLPPHELRMWNSRLYCSYCIMDLQDEERAIQKAGKKAERPAGSRKGSSEEGGKGGQAIEFRNRNGACGRCGRETNTLYVTQGRRLCQKCYFEGDSGTSSPPLSGIGQLAVGVKKLFGIRQAPKILSLENKGKVFDLASRKMVEKKEGIAAQNPISDGKRAEDENERAKRARRKKDPAAKETFFFEHSGMKKKEGRGGKK